MKHNFFFEKYYFLFLYQLSSKEDLIFGMDTSLDSHIFRFGVPLCNGISSILFYSLQLWLENII